MSTLTCADLAELRESIVKVMEDVGGGGEESVKNSLVMMFVMQSFFTQDSLRFCSFPGAKLFGSSRKETTTFFTCSHFHGNVSTASNVHTDVRTPMSIRCLEGRLSERLMSYQSLSAKTCF